MAYLLGWKDILRPIRDGYRHLFPSPDTGPTPEEREKQRQLDRLKGFTYFDNFDQLGAWTEAEADPIQRANTPLLARPPAVLRDGEQKANVLLCHDYSGNYHEYEAAHAIGVEVESYSCEHLQFVDAFIYFSHKLVCVPPPSWTNTLHRNGVKVFGTLLVELQTQGSEKLLRRTSNDDGLEDSVFPMAKKLSGIAKHYGFDGWLVNIEKPFPSNDWNPHILGSFLCHLKEAMSPDGELIWYDALTIDNKIAYQNALTTKNITFASACGAVLTNYCWKEGNAWSSRDLAFQYNLPADKIYFGVDVWAQNKTTLMHPRVTYPEKGGGGTNTGVAVSKLAEIGLSVGVFAPAWSFEHFPGRGREIERAIWDGHTLPDDATCSCDSMNLQHPSNREYPITQSATRYPAGSERFFYTDFNGAIARHGEGEAQRIYNGNTLHSQLGSQSILPHTLATSVAASQSGTGINLLTHRIEAGERNTQLCIEMRSINSTRASVDQIYESQLPLFGLDMPTNGSLQLTISCFALLRAPGAVISLYLKFTKGIKFLRLKDIDSPQLLDYSINHDHGSDKNVRLQELGVYVRGPAFAADPIRVLEVDEIRIVPPNHLMTTAKYALDDIQIVKRGEGEAQHWRLRWMYQSLTEAEPSIPDMPYSDITGPFSYFQIQMDGVELGRAYALEHVLPTLFVTELVGKDVEVVLTGVGFEGRRLARVGRRLQIQ